MTQQATVRAMLAGDMAVVAVRRPSACAAHCKACQGCAQPGSVIEVVAHNGAGALPGERVTVESSTARILSLAGLLYLLPVALLVLGYCIVPWGESLRILGSLAGFILGLALCGTAWKHISGLGPMAFRIVAVERTRAPGSSGCIDRKYLI